MEKRYWVRYEATVDGVIESGVHFRGDDMGEAQTQCEKCVKWFEGRARVWIEDIYSTGADKAKAKAEAQSDNLSSESPEQEKADEALCVESSVAAEQTPSISSTAKKSRKKSSIDDYRTPAEAEKESQEQVF